MLVRASLSGDDGAFRQLVEKYTGPLFNAAYRVTHSREDAVDATQTAFVKAYQKLSSFDFSYRFFSWIYRIALNEALDLTYKKRRESALEDDFELPGDDPEDAYIEAERSRLVQRALMALPADARAIVTMRHIQGLSYADISEILDIPESTVKSRLFTARTRLRALMAQRGWLA